MTGKPLRILQENATKPLLTNPAAGMSSVMCHMSQRSHYCLPVHLPLDQGWANFLLKVQVVNIAGFVGHMVSVAPTQHLLSLQKQP